MDTSPTAPLLAVGGHQQVLLYDTQQFALIGALPFPEGDVFSLTFSVNGELLLVGGGKEGDSGAGVLYNVRKGERVAAFTDFYDTVLAVDISPDHRMVALGGPNRVVRVYRTDTSELAYKIDKHTEWILAVKFTPDGEVLTTADRSGAMYVWQAANGRYVEELKGHAGAIHALSYTADSAYLASAGEDGTVQIWDTWAYTRVRSIAAHSAAVLNLDLGKDNTILTTGQDATTRLFAFDGTAVRTFAGLNDWGYQTCFDNAGTAVLAGSWRGDILVWNKENAEQLRTISTQPSAT
jgi:WD40 repeat protein